MTNPGYGDLDGIDGLPPDYDVRFIPSGGDLDNAAIRALEEIRTLLLLHQEDIPEVISDSLDRIADVVLAASQLKGPAQEKSILVGLNVELEYWLYGHKLNEVQGILFAFLSAARDLKSSELQAKVYRVWGMYLYITQRYSEGAVRAFVFAEEYAQEAGDPYLELLARIEHFNAMAPRLDLDEAHARANVILADARQFNDSYLVGRVYFSLARTYREHSLPSGAFEYAQQALILFTHNRVFGLAAEALSTMIGIVQRHECYPKDYEAQLLMALEKLVKSSVNLSLRAALYHHHAVSFYQRGNYSWARAYALRAWTLYRRTPEKHNVRRTQHVLAMIQAKRRRYEIALRHFAGCHLYYASMGDKIREVLVLHAWAESWLESGEVGTALKWMEGTLSMAQALPDVEVRERLSRNIQEDIRGIERQFAENHV